MSCKLPRFGARQGRDTLGYFEVWDIGLGLKEDGLMLDFVNLL